MVTRLTVDTFLSFRRVLHRFLSAEMFFYAVAKGRQIGIFSTWPECQDQVNGFQGARFKKFNTREEAESYISPTNASPADVSRLSSNKLLKSKLPDVISTDSSLPSISMMKRSEKNYYAVAVGKNPGIFSNWADCKAQIDGVKYPKYRKFNSLEEANQFIQDNAKQKAVDKAEFHKSLKKVYPVSSAQVQQVRQLSTVPYSNHNFQSDNDGYVQVYTDGACENNGKNNAKAGVGVWFGQNHALNVSEAVRGPATNNVAEIEAATRAVQVAKQCGVTKLQINTDSQFLIRCINDWLPNWLAKGWVKSDGGKVINRVQLEELIEAKKGVDVKWNYVPGHRGIEGNEGADRLAREGAARFTKSDKSIRFKPY